MRAPRDDHARAARRPATSAAAARPAPLRRRGWTRKWQRPRCEKSHKVGITCAERDLEKEKFPPISSGLRNSVPVHFEYCSGIRKLSSSVRGRVTYSKVNHGAAAIWASQSLRWVGRRPAWPSGDGSTQELKAAREVEERAWSMDHGLPVCMTHRHRSEKTHLGATLEA